MDRMSVDPVPRSGRGGRAWKTEERPKERRGTWEPFRGDVGDTEWEVDSGKCSILAEVNSTPELYSLYP